MRSRPRRAFGRSRIGVLSLALACAAVTLAGCGGINRTEDGPTLSPLSSAPPPPGAPVKVMTWAPESTTTAMAFPDVPIVAQAFADTINARGGVNGRPLVVISCDERGDAGAAADCARQAVQQKVLAVVGSYSQNGAAFLPILESAGIPYLSGAPQSAEDLTSPMSFPVTGGVITLVAGASGLASMQGCKKVSLVRQDTIAIPDLGRYATAGLATGGAALTATAVIPSGPGPINAQVGDATRDSDCILLITGDQATQRFLAAYQQQGGAQQLFTVGGGQSVEISAQYPDISARMYLTDTLSSAGNGVWRAYRDAMAQNSRGTQVDVGGTVQRRTWVSFEAFLQVARQLTVFNAASMLAALRVADNVDTGGLVPSLNFVRPNALPGLTRLLNPTVTYQRFVDGKLTEFRPGFQDTTPVLIAASAR